MAIEEFPKVEGNLALQPSNQLLIKKYQGLKTTLFTDPNTMQKWPIPVSMSPNPTIDRMLNYLDKTGFLGILNIGMSGSGKSTWSRMLVHMLHQRRNFQVHWFYRDDIQKLDRIIHNLTKGISHILIMDDASFALDKLPKDDINRIAQALTYIRHDVKGQVVVMMNIHYSKALSRFFRNVPFVFLTSITMEEVHTFSDVFPHARWKFKDFAWYYQQMMFNNEFRFEVDRWTGKKMKYHTDRPFRLGLALEGNIVHFFVYLRDSCMICDEDYNAKRIMNSDELVQHFVDAYGKDRARSMIRLYSFARHGLKVIDTKRLSIWNSLGEMDRQNQINWKSVNQILDKDLTRKRRRTYMKKGSVQSQSVALGELGTEPEKSDEELTREEKLFKQEMEEQFADVQAEKQIKKESNPDQEIEDDTEESLEGATYQDVENPIDMSYGYEENDQSGVQDYTKEQV